MLMENKSIDIDKDEWWQKQGEIFGKRVDSFLEKKRVIQDKVEEVIGRRKHSSTAIRVFGDNDTLPPTDEEIFPGVKFRETYGDKEDHNRKH